MKQNTKRLAGAILALISLISACNPAPKYAKPPAPAPSAFKELPGDFKEGPGWKAAQPADDKIRAKWWEIYNDAQLSALEEQVAVSNQSIAASEANFRAARALVVSARSQLYPTLGASPSYSNSRTSSTTRATNVLTTGTGSGTGTNGSGGVTTTGSPGTTGSTTATGTGFSGAGLVNNFFSLPLDLSYTVDFWHRIRNTVAQNAYNAQASAADVATALLSTQAELATYYFELRAVDMQRRILNETLGNYRQNVELTNTLYKTGINSEQELTQAQNQLDTATAQATDLGVARAQYEHAIAMLIGQPASNFSLAVGQFNPNPPPVPVAVPSALLERRPDIAANERRIAAANANIGVARAAYYPNLTLSASGGFETGTFTQWFNWPSRFWALGPTLSQTLFDGGARRALNEQAQAQFDAAVANYRQTVLTSFQAVEDQLAALRILSQEVMQEQTAINSATRYLDLANIRFKTGVDSYLNVITAETAVLTTRETQVAIQLRQIEASVQLVLGLGGGWDPAQLPQMKDLIAKPPHWTPGGTPPPALPPATGEPNPPPLTPSGSR